MVQAFIDACKLTAQPRALGVRGSRRRPGAETVGGFLPSSGATEPTDTTYLWRYPRSGPFPGSLRSISLTTLYCDWRRDSEPLSRGGANRLNLDVGQSGPEGWMSSEQIVRNLCVAAFTTFMGLVLHVSAASPQTVDIELPLNDPGSSNGTGYWSPTTYTEDGGHGGCGTYKCVDFRYADPQAESAPVWQNPQLPATQEVVPAHSGQIWAFREQFDCGAGKAIQTTIEVRDTSIETVYTHLELISVGDWVVVHNPAFSGLNLRPCPQADDLICPPQLMPDETLMKVISGPVRTGAMNGGYTWWEISGEFGTGWAAEAVDQDRRQVLLNSPFHPPDGAAPGDTVYMVRSINLRHCAGTTTGCDVKGSLSIGDEMQIVGGPERVDDYTWWEIDGNPGRGWAVEDLTDPPPYVQNSLSRSKPTMIPNWIAVPGVPLGTLAKNGCANSGPHLHFAVRQASATQQLDDSGPVRIGGAIIFDSTEVSEDSPHNGKITYNAMPRATQCTPATTNAGLAGCPQPSIFVNPTSLGQSVQEGQNATSMSFTVENSGTGTLSYSISDDATWLSVDPDNGTSTDESDEITVNFSTSNLGIGQHDATITIVDSNADNSPQSVAVTLNVGCGTPGNTCDDGDPCTFGDTCNVLGQCVGGQIPCNSPGQCEDAPGTCVGGTCIYQPNTGASCDDGTFCNGSDTCNSGNCEHSGNPCSGADQDADCSESCDESADSCTAPDPNGSSCNDDDACTADDTCNGQGDCLGDPFTCDSPAQCEESPGSCNGTNCDYSPSTGDACDDGNACTTADTCSAGTCIGSSIDCDDGLFCTGVETCVPATGCEPGAPIDPNDGVDCTADTCDEANDIVLNDPQDSYCDDADICNGEELCDAISDCQAGGPLNCDDGDPCTADSCDGVTGCAHVPISDCGFFFDDFDRAGGANIGNGWTEVDGGHLNSYLQGNALTMGQDGGTDASDDAQDTRIFRPGNLHSGISISGVFVVSMSSIAHAGGPALTSRVVVRSIGTAGNPGSGQEDTIPCGFERPGQSPPDCWNGDGFGFNVFTGLDSDPGKWVSIVDNGAELAVVSFGFVNNTAYSFEMQINAQNHIHLYFWPVTGSKPALPTLSFANGGAPYVPDADGNYWQIEVKNGNDTNGTSHRHYTTWEDFRVAPLTVAVPTLGSWDVAALVSLLLVTAILVIRMRRS